MLAGNARSMLVLGLLLGAVPAQARIIFTGYGDFQASPLGRFDVEAAPALLSAFGVTKRSFESRGASIDSLGLFSTADLNDTTSFQVDFTYRDIGQNARTARVQYAFLENTGLGARWRLGKLALPFGYCNENYFYPFRRPSISAPVFNSVVLGLPISDVGGSARRELTLGAARLDGTLQNFGASVAF